MLNHLAKQCHESATRRGYFPAPTIKSNLFEVIHELTELKDALDKGRFANYNLYKEEVEYEFNEEQAYRFHIKDSAEQEYAGALAAILSIGHELRFDIDMILKHEMNFNKIRKDGAK